MSEIIDNEGYCGNCENNHECIDCEVMNLLLDSKKIVIKILENNKKCDIICSNCSTLMKKKNKKSKSEQFWCPNCYINK